MTDRDNKKKRMRIGESSAHSKISEMVSDISDFMKRKRYFSLYLELIFAAVIGILISAGIYIAAQYGAAHYINTELSSDMKKAQREAEHVERLRDYASENAVRLDMSALLESVDLGSRYVQITVYKDIPGNISDEREAATRGELFEYAEQNGMHIIDLADGAVMVSVNDFQAFYYYNVSSSINFIAALLVLIIILLDRVRRIIRQIKRLESDVAVVSYSDMNHRINVEGRNDIAKLSSHVEAMRIAMLDNLRKEQEARNSNTELITSLSHDIRTPLTVMLGYLEMIKEKSTDTAVLEYIATIEKTAMRLKQLSDDMFRYFLAFGNAGEDIRLEEYDANTLIGQMLTEHILLLTECGYRVDVERGAVGADDSVSVVTDADNLMRILDNVFSNLYKYADSTEPIKITITRLGDLITIEIRNKVLVDTAKAESNRIGLRTCARLSEFVAESFEYSEQDGYFTVRLVLRTTVSDGGTILRGGIRK